MPRPPTWIMMIEMIPPNRLNVSLCETGDNPVDDICETAMKIASINGSLIPGFNEIGNHSKNAPIIVVIK